MITRKHAEMLKKDSGIEVSVLEKADVKSFTTEEALSNVEISREGIAFPYFNKDGDIIHYRLRKDVVHEGEGRYHQKKGSRLLPYFLVENLPDIYNEEIPLVITEGEKKLLSFYSHVIDSGLMHCGVVSASGCYGFFKKDDYDERVLTDEFYDLPVSGRRVILIPDTDYFLNPMVKAAYDDLIKILISKGSKVELIDLRHEEEQKLGLDDFLVTYGLDAFLLKLGQPAAVFGYDEMSDEVDANHLSTGLNVNLTNRPNFPELTGYMKDLYDWILETSPIKQPILTYGSVIGIIGTVLSNLYRFYNAHPVFYIMFISRSGSGKDRPLKVPKVIFSDEALKNYIGLAGYRSDASIIDTLPEFRSRLDLLDEVDGVFKISKSDNGYQSGIVNILTELWSESNKFFPGRRTKTDGIYGDCWNPCLNIISALTPTAFRENFTKSMMMTGFGGRFLYLIANDSFEYTDNFVGVDMSDVPDSILSPLRHWHSLKKYDEEKKRFVIQNLPVTPEARELLNRIRKEFFEKAMMLEEDSSLCPIAQRMYENMERLLIVYACSVDPYKPSPLIEVSTVLWCKQFIEALFENSRFFINNNVAASPFELSKSKVLQPIAKAGKKGISHSKLLKNSHLKAKELYEIIRTLEESNLIQVVDFKKRKLYYYIGKE